MGKEKLVFHDWRHAFDEEFTREEKLPPATRRQIEWVIRAWDRVFGAPPGWHICGFPVIKNERFYLHGLVPESEIQVCHIMPRGFASFVLGWDEREVNSPFNLVPMCRQHGLGRGLPDLDYENMVVAALYPDMEAARRDYAGRRAPNPYRRALAARAEMIRRGEPYWNTDWDEALVRKAEEVYYRYLQWQLKKVGKYFDSFPYRKT